MRKQDLAVREFEPNDLDDVYNLIMDTIDQSYTGTYPQEATGPEKCFYFQSLFDCFKKRVLEDLLGNAAPRRHPGFRQSTR